MKAAASEPYTGPLAFYCDDSRHLVCTPYSVPNLHRMAEELGIKRCWFHGGRGSGHAHYDIPKKRMAEIMRLCRVVSAREILLITKGGTP